MKKNIHTITSSWLIKKKKDFTDGVTKLEKLGFTVLNKQPVLKLPSPKEKAEQIHRAFSDKGTDIILAQRGGYSSMKLLPYLDFALIRKHPKVFAGFSDLSTLLNSIYESCGIVTLHAPMVINFSVNSKFSENSFLNAVNNFPQKNLFKDCPVKIYNKGTAKGTLKGGNLVTLTSLISTKWDIKTTGSILFLEDVDEKPHEVDRYLTQWILAGKLKNIKALILGDFKGIKPDDVYAVLSSQMKISFPVVHCPYIGHVKNKITLPVGASVELNTKNKSLIIKSLQH